MATYCFRAKKNKKKTKKKTQNQTAVISAAERTRSHPACPFSFPLSGSAPVKRAVCLSTRRHVRGDFCSHQLQNGKKKRMKERKTIITDAQRRSDALPAAFLPSGTFFFFFHRVPTRRNASILTRDKLRDEGGGKMWRWLGEWWGISQR